MIAGRPTCSSAAMRLVRGCAPARDLGVASPILRHRLAEQLAVLGLVDGRRLGADHLDAELREHARACRASSAVLSAVCPPMVGSRASGRSRSMILATISGVIGSM